MWVVLISHGTEDSVRAFCYMLIIYAQCFHWELKIIVTMGWVTRTVNQRAHREARAREKQALLDQAAHSLSVHHPTGYPGQLPAGVGMCPMCLSVGAIGHLCYSLGCDSFDVSYQPVVDRGPTVNNDSST